MPSKRANETEEEYAQRLRDTPVEGQGSLAFELVSCVCGAQQFPGPKGVYICSPECFIILTDAGFEPV